MRKNVVLKFGGTSVSTPEMLKQAIQITKERFEEAAVAIVVSALGGTTNLLIELAESAAIQKKEVDEILEKIEDRHRKQLDCVSSVSNDDELSPLLKLLKNEVKQIWEKKECTTKDLDTIMSFGERLSVRIFSAGLQEVGLPAVFADTHTLVKTDSNFGDATVDLERSAINLKKAVDTTIGIVVFTGFIGSNSNGNITTIGRSGSDFTAGLVGYSIDADWVEIWTDVDGVFTTDPNLVKEALIFEELTYEFMEIMADNGAKVLHPRTVRPLQLKHTPIIIKNTFNPKAKGTIVRTLQSGAKNKNKQALTTVSIRKNQTFLSTKELDLQRIKLSENDFDYLENKSIQVYCKNQISGLVFKSELKKTKEFIHFIGLFDEGSLVAGSQITLITTSELNPSHVNDIITQIEIYSVKVFGYLFEASYQISFFVDDYYALDVLKIIHKHYCLPDTAYQTEPNHSL